MFDADDVVDLSRMNKSRLKTITIWFILLLCVFILINFLYPLVRLPIYGKVISTESKEPVADAMIEVLFDSLDSDGMEQTLTRTASDGKFQTRARGSARIMAWKPGFQLAWIQSRPSLFIWANTITVPLRKLTPTNLLLIQSTDKELTPNNGFSFQEGRITNSTDMQADITLLLTSTARQALILRSKGKGGIRQQREGDFYSLFEAPESGYEEEVELRAGEDNIYFVRTHDGAHYAKMRLWRCCDENPHHYRVQWAYQSDGTRNLEIKPGKDFPFPLKEFGIQVD
jgi:hypothetical protein